MDKTGDSDRCPGCGGLYVMIGRVHNCRGNLTGSVLPDPRPFSPLIPDHNFVVATTKLQQSHARIAELEAEVARLKAELLARDGAVTKSVTERNAVTESVTPLSPAERQKAYRDRKRSDAKMGPPGVARRLGATSDRQLIAELEAEVARLTLISAKHAARQTAHKAKKKAEPEGPAKS